MQNFMNEKDTYVSDSLHGILKAHSAFLKCAGNDPRAIFYINSPIVDKVSIVTGGGYGHLPLFLGYVGDGLCDGCAVGNIFSPPSFDSIWAVTRQVRSNRGVLFLFGNYFNDSISFLNASEMADLEGIPNETVKICDDISSGADKTVRRGIAGCFFAYKIAGACAAQRNSLQKVKEIAERTVGRTSTYGVAASSCSIPSYSEPIFEMNDDEIDLGAGIHGERGNAKHKFVSSRELVEIMLPGLIDDQRLVAGDRVAVLVNGLGGAAHEDLYIVYNDIAKYLDDRGIHIYKSYVGEYATSLDTAGLSLTLLKLDDELCQYLDAPARSPFIVF